MTLGYRYRWWRQHVNISHAEMAKRCEVQRNTSYSWEGDMCDPTYSSLLLIAAAVGTDLAGFFSRPTAEDVEAMIEAEAARARAEFAGTARSAGGEAA